MEVYGMVITGVFVLGGERRILDGRAFAQNASQVPVVFRLASPQHRFSTNDQIFRQIDRDSMLKCSSQSGKTRRILSADLNGRQYLSVKAMNR